MDLEPIKARAAAATPGPWVVERPDPEDYPDWSENYPRDLSIRCEFAKPINGVRGWAVAKPCGVNDSTMPDADIPALVAEVERLRGWLVAVGDLADIDTDDRGTMVRDALSGAEPPRQSG